MTAMKSYEKLCRGIISCLAQNLGLTRTVSFRSVHGQDNRCPYEKDGDKILFACSKDHPLSVVSNLDDKDALKLNPWSASRRKALGDGCAVVFTGYGSVMKNDRSYINLYVLDSTKTVHIVIDNGNVSCGYLTLVGYRADGKPFFKKPDDKTFLDRISGIVLAYAQEHPAMKRTSQVDVYVIEAGGQKETASTLSACDAVLGRIARSVPSGGSAVISISRRRMTAVRKAGGTISFPSDFPMISGEGASAKED